MLLLELLLLLLPLFLLPLCGSNDRGSSRSSSSSSSIGVIFILVHDGFSLVYDWIILASVTLDVKVPYCQGTLRSQIFVKIRDFRKNLRFSQKSKIFVKIPNFRKNPRFSQKSKILISNFCGRRRRGGGPAERP